MSTTLCAVDHRDPKSGGDTHNLRPHRSGGDERVVRTVREHDRGS